MDCGRVGVSETIKALNKHHINFVGGGKNIDEAHSPTILQSGSLKIGILGYYWNRRTAAKKDLPGSARDTNENLARDIMALKGKVDRIVVTIHWGIPYDRYPSELEKDKARFAIDCGADLIIGHHPHIIQPFELYKNTPIFYSIGNFAFGSGNSKAEAIMLSIKFLEASTELYLFPTYIKNRDRRINYQPRVMTGQSAKESIDLLKSISSESGSLINFEDGIGVIKIRVKESVLF